MLHNETEWGVKFPPKGPTISRRSFRIVIIFTSMTHRTLGGRGSTAAVPFLKMSFMGHCDFEKTSQNQHFQRTLSAGRGSQKKSTLCTLMIMLTILDNPKHLALTCWLWTSLSRPTEMLPTKPWEPCDVGSSWESDLPRPRLKLYRFGGKHLLGINVFHEA